MANIDLIRGQKGNFLFYNIDAAVGDRGLNERTDVLLVQYLLKENTRLKSLSYLQAQEVGGGSPVDGVWTPHWGTLLHNYQNDLRHRGKPIVIDGRVDPVVAGRVRGPIQHMQYTILWLNMGYQEVRPADFPRMAEANDCPGELRPRLKVQFAQAS